MTPPIVVIVLLANGALQQMIQPIAFGATLGIHPLAVLVVTIAGGALFGTIGLVLAAPAATYSRFIIASASSSRSTNSSPEMSTIACLIVPPVNAYGVVPA